MRVIRARGLAGAAGVRGTAIVIDVLRAFTTAAYAFGEREGAPSHPPPPTHPGATSGAGSGCGNPREKSGVREVLLVATPEEALALKAARPELVLVGEVGGRPIPGFDHGNSPERMLALAGTELAGRTLVLRSSSGVQGALAAARSARRVFLGSLVTAAATARAAVAMGEDVTLIAMGSPGGPDGPEDEACAELLEWLLLGRTPEHEDIVRAVRASPAGRQALDPAIDWITPGDLECALAIDRFDFAIEARLEEDRLVARPVHAPA